MRGKPENRFILTEAAETGAERAEYNATASPELISSMRSLKIYSVQECVDGILAKGAKDARTPRR
jgi:hypothetical protein